MADQVRFRLLHDNAPPVHDTGEPYLFGLQTTKQEIIPGQELAGGGMAFDFEPTVKSGRDPEQPAFYGPLASGPVGDRFVYLAWKATERPGYINRLKARLQAITWDQVRDAQLLNKVFEASMAGRMPHDTQPIPWRLV